MDGSSTPTRAQYVSATCVVFTHYSGDTASVVDEHFSRALNFSTKESKGEYLINKLKSKLSNGKSLEKRPYQNKKKKHLNN